MPPLPLQLYRAEQVRELDRLAIETAGVPGLELMSRAGAAVFRLIREQWPTARSLTVFCGAGNNAGDGYIVARLALAAEFHVSVYAVAAPERLKGDAYAAYNSYLEAGGQVVLFQPDFALVADVIVDALLGTGLDRPVSGLYADAIDLMNRQAAPVIAVDIPSGLNADTGNVLDTAVKADCTVSFIGLKQGIFTGSAPEYCGDIVYASLDVPDWIFDRVSASATRVVKTSWPRRNRCAHKGHFGHVLIVGGDSGYAGAARLAGEAALRVGAGLVSLATRPEHAGALTIARPELMCHGVIDAGQLVSLIEKASVIVVGPGLGQSEWARMLFANVIKSEKTIIVDADGLNLLAQLPSSRTHWILTPHPGEAARLLNCSTAAIQQDRFAAASALRAKYGGVAILKGAGTLIASKDGIGVSTTGNPGMATGGMGDVLAGVIAGLLAQGLSLTEATQQGVYLHGKAADLAAEELGERGLLAGDLLPMLRRCVNE